MSARRVRIVGNHPHRGETGTVAAQSVSGVVRVDLDQPSTADACYATSRHLRSLPADEDAELNNDQAPTPRKD